MKQRFVKELGQKIIALIAIFSASVLGLASTAGATDTFTGVSITGVGSVGSTLTSALAGAGAPTYAWFDCTSPVSAGTDVSTSGCAAAITAATSATYVVASSDYGYYVTVRVTGVSTGGPYYAASIGVGVQLAPTITNASFPVVNATASQGLTGSLLATFDAGTTAYASGAAASFTLNGASLSYQWYRCSATNAGSLSLTSGCTSISGATSSSYILSGSDATYFVMYSVTATGTVGSPQVQYSGTSASSVSASAPVNTGVPVLSGQTSYNIATSAGTWTGVPSSFTYSYSWFRCAASQTSGVVVPTNCTVISGATASSYSFVAGDLNKYLISGVSASNGVFTTPVVYFSASSSQITGGLPVVVTYPTISPAGSVGSGQTVSVSTGTWAGFPLPTSYTYAWYSCTNNGGSVAAQGSSSVTLPASLGVGFDVCTTLSNATATLAITTQTFIVAEVIANNGNGAYYSYSAVTPVIIAAVPSRSGAVIVSSAGGVFSVTTTGWSGQPTPGISYQWYRCTAASDATYVLTVLSSLNSTCVAISGATSQTYSAVLADVTAGKLLVAETGANSAGGLVAYSATSALAATIASLTGTGVSITGSPLAGSTLSAVNGGWTALPAPTYTYQWYDCTSHVATAASLPAGCTPISGATASTYVPTVTEVGLNSSADYVVVSVTATNSAGISVQFSGATEVLTSSRPVAASAPSVPASATTIASITATPGNWLGAPVPTLSYQWFYCTSSVASAGTTVPSTCTSISGANSISYLPSGSYAGDYFVIGVTGSNGVTSGGATTNVTVYSASTLTPLVSTLSITGLVISGSSIVGGTLSASSSVSGVSSYSTAFQWYNCIYVVSAGTSVPFGCYVIAGATGSSYSPTAGIVGYYVTVLQSVTSSTTSATAVANSTQLVATNIPGASAYIYATSGIGSATVTWYAPTTGAAVTNYAVSSVPAGFSCTSVTTSCVVRGLSAGISYTFSVIASNSYGSGVASSASYLVVPTSAIPVAPASISAVAQPGSATLTWESAVANGALVTLYTVTSSPAGGSCTSAVTSCTVSSLVNGTAYTFSVVATNAVGTSASSVTSNAVTPRLPVSNAPTGVVAVVGNRTLSVSWNAAISAGGPVTSYRVSVSNVVGAGTVSSTCAMTATLSCMAIGLTNGTPYTVSVIAVNSTGDSLSSLAVSGTPATVPSAPKIARITATSGGFNLIITAPVSSGGSAITKYQYSLNSGRTWSSLSVTSKVVGLNHRLTYTVCVRALNALGFSAKSALARVVTK